MGHSTGAQLMIVHARSGFMRQAVTGYILHSPVSDSDWLQHTVSAEVLASWAAMDDDDIGIFPGTSLPVPMRAGRMRSLMGDEGAMFSIQADQNTLTRLLGHMAHVNVLILLAGDEEYVPPGYDAIQQLHRLLQSMGRDASSDAVVQLVGSTVTGGMSSLGRRKDGAVLTGANHASEGKEEHVVDRVRQWIGHLVL